MKNHKKKRNKHIVESEDESETLSEDTEEEEVMMTICMDCIF